MSRVIVATGFVWSHYPGLRPGLVYSGTDITRHPTGETHVVDGDAAETVCGLARASFAHDFAEGTALGKRAAPCSTCRPA